ncbi:MAG: J domain-containing protein [Burkholderiales bacterium]|nr:J domain-containing protein [Burkholderiales bacterium]
MLNPHDELGLSSGASLAQIKKAYRRLAARWHPDRNADPQAMGRMQRINQAYRQLCDWDDSGSDDDVADVAPAPPPAQPHAHTEKPKAKPKRAWWERHWGAARWQPDGQIEPATLRLDATISLEAAAFSCLHRVQGLITDLCEDCAGVGRWVAPGTACSVCDGEGRVPGQTASTWVVCGHCHGDGSDRKPCDTCAGSGQAAQTRSYHYEVRIPPGLRDGQAVVLRGQGQRCGEQCGDLALTIHVLEHPWLRWRADQELACEVPVDLYTALGQGVVEVPSLEGHLIKISLRDGTEQVLAGMGFPRRDGTRGPLHVSIRTVAPAAHDAAQQALLQKLADSLKRQGYQACPELAAWQQKIKARS